MKDMGDQQIERSVVEAYYDAPRISKTGCFRLLIQEKNLRVHHGDME
jgi:hypothetical protein